MFGIEKQLWAMNKALHMWVYEKYRYYTDMLKNALVKMKGQF